MQSDDVPDERRIAVHQAGHAWAYVKLGRSIVYATIRARKPRHDLPDETPGLVLPSPRRIDPYSRSLIAAAGPIAETTWQIRYRIGTGPDPGLGWVHQFNGTLRASGHGDTQSMVPELLNSEQWITVLRADIEDDFDQIQALARRLCEAGTIKGTEIHRLLTHAHPSGG